MSGFLPSSEPAIGRSQELATNGWCRRTAELPLLVELDRAACPQKSRKDQFMGVGHGSLADVQSVAALRYCDLSVSIRVNPWLAIQTPRCPCRREFPVHCIPWLPCVTAIYPCRSVSIRGLRFRHPGAPAAANSVALHSVAALRYWDLSVSIRVHPWLAIQTPRCPSRRGSRCIAFRGCPALLRFIRIGPCQSVACDSGALVPLPPRIPLH